MARPAPDRDVAPTVQKLRLRYAKRGRLRFSSHRDFQRALERALRRADIPMAFSAGFHPHPKVSYANAAPTGVASEAEYVEIGLTRECDPDEVCRVLDAALPPGLDIVEVVAARTSDFTQRLEASEWRVELRGVTPELAALAVAQLLAAEEIQVERLTKDGVRRFDARGAVLSAQVQGEAPVAGDESAPPCAILLLVVQHGTPAVRPDDVISALRLVADLVPPKPPRVTRLAQGPLTESGTAVADPLAPDRAG
jgi:radical SAM-linked protein